MTTPPQFSLDAARDIPGPEWMAERRAAAGARLAELDGLLGAASDASPDAFTVVHDAFLAGGAFVKVPRGVVVEKPIVILHWSEGDGLASFPHTLVVAEEAAEVTVFERHGSPDTGRG